MNYREFEWCRINSRWSRGFTPKCASCKFLIEKNDICKCKKDKHIIDFKQSACFKYEELPISEQISIFSIGVDYEE